MLELHAAPSPSPLVPTAPPSPSESSSANASASSNANEEAASPFAAVLQNHLKPPSDSKAAKPDKSADKPDARKEEAPAPTSVSAPVDALALLAPMLAGLAPAPPAAVPAAIDKGENPSAGSEDGQTGDPALSAATVLPADLVAPSQSVPAAMGPVPPSAPPAVQSSLPAAQSSLPADQSGLPAAQTALSASQSNAATARSDTLAAQPAAQPKAEAALSPSAILAAEAAAKPESSAETGKVGVPTDSFASLLNTARETQIMAAHGAAAPHVASPATPPTPSTTVATPVGAHGWDSEVGDKLTWMVGRQETRAELVLNPPQLGRIEVSLSLNGDQANAVFVSANPAVREALENAMPRLREILQDAGVSLGQTQVGAESFQQSANNRESGDNPARNNGRNGNGGPAELDSGFVALGSAQVQWSRRGNGLVDTFA